MAKTYKDKKGYSRFTDSKTLVHRWAAEKQLGRKLRKGEVVHHKNRDKTDNSPGNLHVFKNQAAHDRVHKYDARKHGRTASYQGFRNASKPALWKFWLSILFDLLGVVSIFFGPPGWLSDIVYAPIYKKWIKTAYPGEFGRIMSWVGLVEELTPLVTDILPTATLTHAVLWYRSQKARK